MRCLRCGREIGDKTVCVCHHFYETNLNKKTVKKKKSLTLIEILAIIIIVSILLIMAIPMIIKYVKLKEEVEEKQKAYCTLVCEGHDFSISNYTCYCSSGQEFLIQE